MMMESKELLLRETIFSDCVFFAQCEKEKTVTEFFSMNENRSYEDVVREFLTAEQSPEQEMFTIVLKETERPIGKLWLTHINHEDDSLDLHRIYIADPKLRGRGYGETALRLILDYAFINLHMERVTIDHFMENNAAAGLYQKLGFKYEGIGRNACKKDGKYFDLHFMSMLRSEYYARLKEQPK